MGRGGCIVVCALAFYSDNPKLKSCRLLKFYSQYLGKTKINEKEAAGLYYNTQ